MALGGVTIVANTCDATVIDLQSHPAWIAAHRYDREREEAIRRHPSFRARRDSTQFDRKLAAGARSFKRYPSTDTPA
jgi:hypothetical protein